MTSSFSRMRSEGFPFIVGVWGWTCVRVVFLVSSSPRRRLVVVSSSRRRRQLVNSLPLGGTLALRHNPYFQSMKSGGSLARNARFGVPKSQNVRSFWCFAWQAQYFGSVSMQARCFFLAGAALCDVAFRDVVAGAAFCDVAKVLFPRIAMAVTCKRDTTANIVAGAGFGDCLEKWRKLRKSHTFWALWKWLYKKNSHEIVDFQVESVEFEGSLARNARFGASNFQGERSFSCFAWQAQDFGSSLLEKLRKPRTICSFWKLVPWKVEEASHEMLVLEACSLKSWGSLARNARFGSLFLEKLRKPRTKCSFWKLVPWKVEEASHEMLVLEACSLKSWGSLARNARFGR